jgi:hypothetical protein
LQWSDQQFFGGSAVILGSAKNDRFQETSLWTDVALALAATTDRPSREAHRLTRKGA